MRKRLRDYALRWVLNVLVAVDQGTNALCGGDPDETVSSRLGKIKRRHGGRVPRWRLIFRALDWALERIDPGHSRRAIDNSVGDEAVLDRERRRRWRWK